MRLPTLVSLSLLLIAAFAVCPPAVRADEPLVNEALVDGSVDEIWSLITTKEGMESWMVPHAEVNLRKGGLLR
ncbi:MAG TPA: hypothetical protein VJW75_02015, partial [Candidatus Eisenbacteria bacterium]|nr:hypothetical protein [Candidatus Eisenbacteria bacterium]